MSRAVEEYLVIKSHKSFSNFYLRDWFYRQPFVENSATFPAKCTKVIQMEIFFQGKSNEKKKLFLFWLVELKIRFSRLSFQLTQWRKKWREFLEVEKVSLTEKQLFKQTFSFVKKKVFKALSHLLQNLNAIFLFFRQHFRSNASLIINVSVANWLTFHLILIVDDVRLFHSTNLPLIDGFP